MANGFTASWIVLFSFLNAWSSTSSAGGSCTQRMMQVGMVSMSGVHSCAMLAVASSAFGNGLG